MKCSVKSSAKHEVTNVKFYERFWEPGDAPLVKLIVVEKNDNSYLGCEKSSKNQIKSNSNLVKSLKVSDSH